MTMRRCVLLAALCCAYATALVALAPATLLDAAAEHWSHGRIRVAQAQGTLWAGSGLVEIRNPHARGGAGRHLSWRLVPQRLLRGELVFEVRADTGQERFEVRLSPSQLAVANAAIELPARALGAGIPRLAPLGLTGDLLLHAEHVTIDANRITFAATLRWVAAGSSLSSLAPLGDYEMRVQHADSGSTFRLRTLSGPLHLDGDGAWPSGTQPVLVARARVSPPYREQLDPLLRLIGVERSDGTFELAL